MYIIFLSIFVCYAIMDIISKLKIDKTEKKDQITLSSPFKNIDSVELLVYWNNWTSKETDRLGVAVLANEFQIKILT